MQAIGVNLTSPYIDCLNEIRREYQLKHGTWPGLVAICRRDADALVREQPLIRNWGWKLNGMQIVVVDEFVVSVPEVPVVVDEVVAEDEQTPDFTCPKCGKVCGGRLAYHNHVKACKG